MFCPFQLSEDGIEMQFATNHLGRICNIEYLQDETETVKNGCNHPNTKIYNSLYIYIYVYICVKILTESWASFTSFFPQAIFT